MNAQMLDPGAARSEPSRPTRWAAMQMLRCPNGLILVWWSRVSNYRTLAKSRRLPENRTSQRWVRKGERWIKVVVQQSEDFR